MRRVSVVAASGGVSMRSLLVGMITRNRVGPIREEDHGSEYPAPIGGDEVGSEPEEAADDRVARLHCIAPLVGRLPLGEERAIVKLKTRWLLGDVDVGRCTREYGGYR
jgi:hypothetical protein